MSTVLLVDDDLDARSLLAMLLELDGHTVHTSSDGLEAMEALRKGLRPCVILLDLMMPNLDGAGVVREMRRDPSLAGLPVVLVSGVADLDEAASELGVAATMTKPVDPDELLRAVRDRCPPERCA
jgi:CheY-like chemotaxis protein